MNLNPKTNFFVIGLLDDKVIARCFVSNYVSYDNKIEKNDEFLISYLVVDPLYQKQGYGTKLIDYVITLLKELNAVKVAAFTCDESKKLFKNLGFIKKEEIKEFGSTVPEDDTDIYYELRLPHNFFLAGINEKDTLLIGRLMEKELDKYESRIPKVLLPHKFMYKDHILNLNSQENELCKFLRCGKMLVGYTYMFYEDYDTEYGSDHSVHLSFFIDEDYLYESAIKVMVEEAESFLNLHKNDHHLEQIKVFLNEYTIIMKRYDFYKRCLLNLGFEESDKETFIKNV